MVIFQNVVLILILLALIFFTYFRFIRKPKAKKNLYKITVYFAHGIKTKLILSAEQYEKFQAWLLLTEGKLDLDNEEEGLKLYREYVCMVDVKKK